jgi:hypothetical protein
MNKIEPVDGYYGYYYISNNTRNRTIIHIRTGNINLSILYNILGLTLTLEEIQKTCGSKYLLYT